MPPRPPAPAGRAAGEGDFEALRATVLFCNRCRGPRPVRERLLLVLPDGELNEYVCAACGSSVGKRTVTAAPTLLVPR